jgi:hypothetical protein
MVLCPRRRLATVRGTLPASMSVALAQGRAEHQVVIGAVWSQRQPLRDLPLALLPERIHCRRVETILGGKKQGVPELEWIQHVSIEHDDKGRHRSLPAVEAEFLSQLG